MNVDGNSMFTCKFNVDVIHELQMKTYQIALQPLYYKSTFAFGFLNPLPPKGFPIDE